jgi:hypothetical protein
LAVEVTSLVWKSTVPAPERFTLLALADLADATGECWPAIKYLAGMCCTGESTVRRHIQSLEKLGVLTVRQRFNNSSWYTISLSQLTEMQRPDLTNPGSRSDRGCQSDRGSQDETGSQIERNPPVKVSATPSQSEHLPTNDPPRDPSGGTRKRAHRLPEDWTVSEEMRAWARKHTPLVGRVESEQFIDYWHAESGAKARKVDWVKAWQVWMRREQKSAERRPGSHLRSVQTQQQPQLPADPDAALADLIARADAAEAARLLREPLALPSQPPSDTTPPQQWRHDRSVEWIRDHSAELRQLLERQAG